MDEDTVSAPPPGRVRATCSLHSGALEARPAIKHFFQRHRFQVGLPVMEVINVLHKLLDDVGPIDHVYVELIQDAEV